MMINLKLTFWFILSVVVKGTADQHVLIGARVCSLARSYSLHECLFNYILYLISI